MTVIDRNDFLEYVPTNARSLVQDEHFDEITLTYGSIFRAHGNKASFIQATLESVNEENNTICFRTPNNPSVETLSFDYLVICTGSM